MRAEERQGKCETGNSTLFYLRRRSNEHVRGSGKLRTALFDWLSYSNLHRAASRTDQLEAHGGILGVPMPNGTTDDWNHCAPGARPASEFKAQVRSVTRLEEQIRKASSGQDKGGRELNRVLRHELSEMQENNCNIGDLLAQLVTET